MSKVIIIILCLFLPPIAVFLKEGIGKHLLINIVLCLLGFLPGVIHALYIATRS